MSTEKTEGAACRPAAEPTAWLWQHKETGHTRVVMPTQIIATDAAWSVVGPLFLGAPPAPTEQWVSVEERLPEPGKAVLLDIGKKTPIRAMWAAKYTVSAIDDDTGWSEYDEESDTYYCPEGWYEWNEHDEVHWLVDDKALNWQHLPAPPDTSANKDKS